MVIVLEMEKKINPRSRIHLDSNAMDIGLMQKTVLTL